MDKNSKKIKSFEPKKFYVNYRNEILTISKEPIDGVYPCIEIPKEHKLTYKKSYMNMLNRYFYKQGAIDKEIFEKAKVLIEKINKV